MDLTEALIAVPAYDQSSDQEVAFQAVDYILRVLKEKYGAWNDMGKSHAWICRTVVQG